MRFLINALDSVKRQVDFRLRLLLLAFILVALTFAYPTISLNHDVFSYIFVFDITQSMNVQDTGSAEAPMTRLSFAKQATQGALDKMPCGSTVGLALFCGHRTFLLFAPVEVCEHYGELFAMVEKIDWRMAWEARSEIAKGLYSSLRVAKQLGNQTGVVFFTDGHEAPPVHAEYRPVFRGEPGDTRGIIVGVGGLNPVPIPKLDRAGKFTGYWSADEVMQVDPYSRGRISSMVDEAMVGIDNSDLQERIESGTEHLSSLREPYLKRLATETRLRYFRLELLPRLVPELTAPALANHITASTDFRWLPASLAVVILVFLSLPLAKKPDSI